MQQPPNYPPSPYHQSPQTPLPHQRLWRWFRSRPIVLQVLIGVLIISCTLCTCVLSVAGNPTKNVTQAPIPTATQAPVSSATATTELPTATPTPGPTPSPTLQPTQAKPTPTPTPSPTPSPLPQPTQAKPTPASTHIAQNPIPTPTPCIGVNDNPWCYNFVPGNLIYAPNPEFCSYFTCVSTFWSATRGYVVECADGHYSHSGGVRGTCSRNGGVNQPLYSH